MRPQRRRLRLVDVSPVPRGGVGRLRMDQLLEFITNHPWLVGAFLLLLILSIRNELSRGGRAVNAQELVNMVNREGAVVIDVRDSTEFRTGHVVGALNIPHTAIAERLSELQRYKDKPLVVMCKMGQHAGSVGVHLRKAGFINVTKLRGGVSEWRSQNLPLVKS